MNKERKIEETISKVFKALAEAPRDSAGEAWMTGNQLREVTNLSPMEINDVVSILGQQGYVELGETYGVAPFDFNVVTLNARGRLEFERMKTQEAPKPEEKKEKHGEWDLFICHATEDKEEIVRPLVKALIDEGFNVWYDEFTLTLGDSLRRSIDKGLAQSRYGLAILSPNFFAKNWPQTELDGLAARERNGEKVILPVWHKVDREYVTKFSPTLADRYAVSTEKGIDFIVKEILKVVKPSETMQAQKAREGSVTSKLHEIVNSLRGKDKESIKKIIRQSEFNNLKQKFMDVLDGIAILELPESKSDESVFAFIELAILERNKNEATDLFETLLGWFFQTVTPRCRLPVLKIFAKLTRLSFLKEIVSKTGRASSFVAEFGLSNSYEIAGMNAEILMNIQSFLSDTDLDRFVDHVLSNDQIRFSWKANRYLEKLLRSCEGRADRGKIEELRKKLAEHT